MSRHRQGRRITPTTPLLWRNIAWSALSERELRHLSRQNGVILGTGCAAIIIGSQQLGSFRPILAYPRPIPGQLLGLDREPA